MLLRFNHILAHLPLEMDANNGSDDDFQNPLQVYERLIELISNETESPELLPYEETVIEHMIEQIDFMKQNIKRLTSKLEPFCIEQHLTEIERHSYAVNKYLRTRIEKIELNSISLIKILLSNRKRVEKLMSKNEIKYLDNYVTSIDHYLNDSVLGNLPFVRTPVMNFALRDVPIDDKQQFENTYVFVRALKPTQVLVDHNSGQESIQLEKDSQHFLPYSAVRTHLISGSRDLLLI